jgi:hypothetical protein
MTLSANRSHACADLDREPRNGFLRKPGHAARRAL